MKNKLNLQTISIFVALIPIIVYGLYYNSLPLQIPTHWDFYGNINGYSSKLEFLLLALLPLIISILFIILPKIDPKKMNYNKFSGFLQGFTLATVIILSIVFFICLYTAFNQDTKIIKNILPFCIGIFLIFIGNYLPKVKPNFFIGIRTPWTISSETVWIKTHRKGGISFIILGIFIAISPYLTFINTFVYVSIILITILSPLILSYIYFKQENK